MTAKKKKRETEEKLGKVHKASTQKKENPPPDAKSGFDYGELLVDFSDLVRLLDTLLEKPPEKKKVAKASKPK